MSVQETYEATQAQQERIHNEIKESQALISPFLALITLEKDFEGHVAYLNNIKTLITKYKGIRRVRGDGNCLYRSFGFALLEYLVNKGDKDSFEILKEQCLYYKNYLIEKGYSEFTLEDFSDQFIEMINLIQESNGFFKLEELFNDQGYSDYYIVFFKLIVSSYLQIHADYYQAFIEEGLTMKQFCEKEVEPMYVESDNIHIIALSKALNVTIYVENLQNCGDICRLKFSKEDDNETTSSLAPIQDTTIEVVLLYRPGHYDILYEEQPNQNMSEQDSLAVKSNI